MDDPNVVVEHHKIQIDSLSKRFKVRNGTLEVLRDISLEARPGEFLSVIGPSGCGKSTIFNILAGLEPPTSGEIRIDGRLATGEIETFAYMPQKDLLLPWRRIIDNTTLGLEVAGMKRKVAKAKAGPLFETFGLKGFEESYPFQLSGGMRQRAALLRTVVQDREVLLLDEPFGALDSLTRTEMQQWLSMVWEKYHWTVILVTHDIREAVFLSDRVAVLSARPTVVRAVHEVDIPRPRGLEVVTDPAFVELEAKLLATLQEESYRAHVAAGEVA
jgi:ABC-type nitrate/sulfonate/bicarbonate transport system ATPase subunit